MKIFWICKFSFILMLSITMLSEAFGQSLILDSIHNNSVLINHQSLVDFLHADPKTNFVIDAMGYSVDDKDKLNQKKDYFKKQRAKSKIVQQDTITDPLPEMNEIFPEPPDGSVGFKNWVINNYKVPAAAVKAKVTGRLIINFTIEKDGQLSNFQISQNIGYHTGEALIELIRKSSPWKPGFQNGRAVKCGYTYPLSFSDGELKLDIDTKRQR